MGIFSEWFVVNGTVNLSLTEDNIEMMLWKEISLLVHNLDRQNEVCRVHMTNYCMQFQYSVPSSN